MHSHKATFYLHRSVFLPVNIQYDLAEEEVDPCKNEIQRLLLFTQALVSHLLPSLCSFLCFLYSIWVWWWHVTEFPWLKKPLCIVWPSVTGSVLLVHSWRTGSFMGFFYTRWECAELLSNLQAKQTQTHTLCYWTEKPVLGRAGPPALCVGSSAHGTAAEVLTGTAQLAQGSGTSSTDHPAVCQVG